MELSLRWTLERPTTKWYILQQALRIKGFTSQWRQQVASYVHGGSVAVKVNDDIDHYFQTQKD